MEIPIRSKSIMIQKHSTKSYFIKRIWAWLNNPRRYYNSYCWLIHWRLEAAQEQLALINIELLRDILHSAVVKSEQRFKPRKTQYRREK